MRIETERRIIVRSKAGKVIGYVKTTHCWWCTDEAVCSLCSSKADAIRKAQEETDHADQ